MDDLLGKLRACLIRASKDGDNEHVTLLRQEIERIEYEYETQRIDQVRASREKSVGLDPHRTTRRWSGI